MKVLALHQPHAQLVADGYKRVETRPWHADKYRLLGERVAIQATKTGMTKVDFLRLLASFPRIFDCLVRYTPLEVAGGGEDAWLWKHLPRGVILATAVVDRCEEMTAELIAAQTAAELDFGKRDADLRALRELSAPFAAIGRQVREAMRVFGIAAVEIGKAMQQVVDQLAKGAS